VELTADFAKQLQQLADQAVLCGAEGEKTKYYPFFIVCFFTCNVTNVMCIRGLLLVHGVQVEQYCISTEIPAMRELHHRCVPFTGSALVETSS